MARCRCTCGCPKLKGFKNPFRTEYQVVNLDRLAALFPDGGEVDPDVLAAKGAVRRGQLVKILGSGEVAVALQVKAHAFSGTAAEKIAAAGGSVDPAVGRRPAANPLLVFGSPAAVTWYRDYWGHQGSRRSERA